MPYQYVFLSFNLILDAYSGIKQTKYQRTLVEEGSVISAHHTGESVLTCARRCSIDPKCNSFSHSSSKSKENCLVYGEKTASCAADQNVKPQSGDWKRYRRIEDC